jgi:hypothetical protein
VKSKKQELDATLVVLAGAGSTIDFNLFKSWDEEKQIDFINVVGSRTADHLEKLQVNDWEDGVVFARKFYGEAAQEKRNSLKGCEYYDRLDHALRKVADEVIKAKETYKDNFNSVHEGYGVIMEEIDELWTEIKAKQFNKDKGEKEATQCAAMLLRFIVELTENR